MSLLKDAIFRFEERIEVLKPQFPKVSSLERSAFRFAEMPGVSLAPADEVRRRVREAVFAASQTPAGFATLTSRELRVTPWLLWDPERPLIKLAGFLEFLLERAKRRVSLCLTLIEAWLQAFRPHDNDMNLVGRHLSEIALVETRGRLAAWSEAHKRYRIFSPGDDFAALVRDLLTSQEDVNTILKRAGLHEPLRARSGYMLAVQSALLSQSLELLKADSADRVITRIQAIVTLEGNELRFGGDTMLGQIAQTLTAPWRDGLLASPSPLQGAVLDFLLAHLQDPRIKPGSWRTAGTETVALVKQWLARANLGAFFELVRRHVSNPEHFQYRRPFWAAYLEAGHIQDAWIALGNNVAAEARTIPDLKGTYGRLQGVDENKALILMRIKGSQGRRDLIAAEWSDNGKLRMWLADDRQAPKLGGATYTPDEVRKPCLPFPINQGSSADEKATTGLVHMGSPNGRWQWRAARRIYLEAGVQVPAKSYMPK